MTQSEYVEKLEEERKFLKLYHDDSIKSVNISRILGLHPDSITSSRKTGATQSEYKTTLNTQEYKEVFQALRISSFVKKLKLFSSSMEVYNKVKSEITDHAIKKLGDQIARSGQNPDPKIVSEHSYYSIQKQLYEQKVQLVQNAIIYNRHIKHLDLSNTFIGNSGLSALAKLFERNKVLEYLDISSNIISGYPAHSSQPDSSQIFAKAIKGYKALKHLDLSNNQFDVSRIKLIYEALQTLESLEFLSINSPGRGEELDEMLTQIINNNKGLKTLNIEGHNLTIKKTEIAKDTEEEAKESESAEKVQIDTQAAEAQAKEAEGEVEDEAIISYSNPFLTAMATNKSITHLNLSRCLSASGEVALEVAKLLAEMIRQNKSLESLNLSLTSIIQPHIGLIVDALIENKTIKAIDLSSNSFQEDDGEDIARLIKENGTIQELNISKSGINYAGIKPIADSLGINENIQKLDISGNGFDEAGGLFIGLALKANQHLVFLDISGNDIQAAGLIYLASALAVNPRIKHLNLSNNKLVKNPAGASLRPKDNLEGVKAFAESMTHLETLDLRNNGLNTQAWTILSEAFKENKSLVELYIGQNSISSSLGEILKSLSHHPHLLLLDISKSKIGAGLADVFLQNFTSNLSVAILNLSDNGLGVSPSVNTSYAPPLQKFIDFFKQNFTISFLDISENFQGHPYELHNHEENPLQQIAEASSLVTINGLTRGVFSLKASEIIEKHREKLFENLLKLEQKDAEFELKELLAILKQLQSAKLSDIEPELSRHDIKENDFYIKRIAEIFFEKYYKPKQAELAKAASEEEALPAEEKQAEEVAAPPEEEAIGAEAAVAEEVAIDPNILYYDALVGSSILGMVESYVDSLS